MDEITKALIEKYEGLDNCCGKMLRMFCPRHMWEVPSIYRKRFLTKVEKEGLTNKFLNYIKEKHYCR